MSKLDGQKNGGQIMAKRQRETAIDEYYRNPNYCLQCNKTIEVNDQKVSTIKKKKFCNQSCAAIYNNLNRNKNLIISGVCQKNRPIIEYKTKGQLFNSRKN